MTDLVLAITCSSCGELLCNYHVSESGASWFEGPGYMEYAADRDPRDRRAHHLAREDHLKIELVCTSAVCESRADAKFVGGPALIDVLEVIEQVYWPNRANSPHKISAHELLRRVTTRQDTSTG